MTTQKPLEERVAEKVIEQLETKRRIRNNRYKRIIVSVSFAAAVFTFAFLVIRTINNGHWGFGSGVAITLGFIFSAFFCWAIFKNY